MRLNIQARDHYDSHASHAQQCHSHGCLSTSRRLHHQSYALIRVPPASTTGRRHIFDHTHTHTLFLKKEYPNARLLSRRKRSECPPFWNLPPSLFTNNILVMSKCVCSVCQRKFKESFAHKVPVTINCKFNI
jgi:hypothetical protein